MAKPNINFVTIVEARKNLAKVIQDSQRTPQVLLRFGEPVVVIHGVQGSKIEDVFRDWSKKEEK